MLQRTRTTWSLLAAASLLVLSACGGAPKTPAPAAAPQQQAQTPAPGTPAPAPAPAPAGKLEPAQVRLMTGPQGGSWVPLGGAIAEMVQKQMNGVSVTVQPGAGIANVKAIFEGKADLGFGNANSTADGTAGRAPFEKPTANVKHLLTLYNQYFQVVVPEDSGIKTMADLKGKRIAVQPKGNTGEQITREILQAYGLKYEDMAKVHHVSYTDAVELIKNRQADAFTLITTIPASAVMDLATGRKVRVIPIPDDKIAEMRKLNSGYAKLIIPKGTYPEQNEDAATVGTFTHLVASDKVSDELAFQLVKLLVEKRQDLAAIVKDIGKMSPKDMAVDVGVPFHPGAERYFKSVK